MILHDLLCLILIYIYYNYYYNNTIYIYNYATITIFEQLFYSTDPSMTNPGTTSNASRSGSMRATLAACAVPVEALCCGEV